MARSLAVVGVAGLAISVVCLALAKVVSPDQGYSYPFSSQRNCDRDWRGSDHGDAPVEAPGKNVTRDFRWNGGRRLDICIPGTVYFTPGPPWRVSVTGPEASVNSLRIDDGVIYFDGPFRYPRSSSLEVHITGPSLQSFGLRGSGTLMLDGILQKNLDIDLFGSGSVHGRGTVGTLDLRIFGSGNADLAKLAARDVDITLFGSGNADIAPTGDVDVLTFGSGDARLHKRPRHVSTTSFGSGRTIQLESGKDRP